MKVEHLSGDLRYVSGTDIEVGQVEQYDGSGWIRIFVPPPASPRTGRTPLQSGPGVETALIEPELHWGRLTIPGQAAADRLRRRLDEEQATAEEGNDVDSGG